MFVIPQDDCPLDLRLTLMESGQSFVWNFDEGAGLYGAALGGRAVWLRPGAGGLEAHGDIPEDALRRYLGLEDDYGALQDADDTLGRAVRALPGLRVLRQDPWDTLVQFLISQNNNIKRIRGLTQKLMRACGPRLDTPFGALYGMPGAESLAGLKEDALRALGMGYRAAYLIGAARRVAEGFPLWELSDLPYAEAHARLLELPGVGDKVADCVLLFGCAHDEAFPVDVWVERLLRGWYGFADASRGQLADRARERFGPRAGIAQQFLFHAARTGLIPLEDKGDEQRT